MSDKRTKRWAWVNQPTRRGALEAAEAVFVREGYAAATMDGIAKQAGMARSHLYYHFKTKQDLLDDLIELRTGELIADRQQLRVDLAVGQSREEIVRTLLTEVLPRHRDFLRLILSESLRDSSTWSTARAAIDATIDDVADLLGVDVMSDDRRERLTWLVVIPIVFHAALGGSLAGANTLSGEAAHLIALALRSSAT